MAVRSRRSRWFEPILSMRVSLALILRRSGGPVSKGEGQHRLFLTFKLFHGDKRHAALMMADIMFGAHSLEPMPGQQR